MVEKSFRALAAKALEATRQDAPFNPNIITPPPPHVKISDLSFTLTETEKREIEEAKRRILAIMTPTLS